MDSKLFTKSGNTLAAASVVPSLRLRPVMRRFHNARMGPTLWWQLLRRGIRGLAPWCVCAIAAVMAGPAQAQDAARGRSLFSELPNAPAQGSCISCHGNPAFNINNILSAAGDPNRLVRATNTVSAMGFLRGHLGASEIADVAAFLATVVAEGAGAPMPTALPHVDHFGSHQLGSTSASRSIQIGNRTGAPVAIAQVLSSRPHRFAVTHDCPPVLNDGGACSAEVRFVPGFAGGARALVSVIGTDGRTLRSAVVSGSGVAGPAARLDWLVDAPTLQFGDIAVGSNRSAVAALSNPSARPTTVDTLRIVGPQADHFALVHACQRGPLSPGASCVAEVRYQPAIVGPSHAWIEVVADAGSPPLLRLQASAFAAPPASAPPTTPPPPPAASEAASGQPAAQASGGGLISAGEALALLLLTGGLRWAAWRAPRRGGRRP